MKKKNLNIHVQIQDLLKGQIADLGRVEVRICELENRLELTPLPGELGPWHEEMKSQLLG